MHPGRGPGLTSRRLGEKGGSETITLAEGQMPQHNHSLQAVTQPASANSPSSTTALARSVNGYSYNSGATADSVMDTGALLSTGGSSTHNNMQPFLTINFIIALAGLYPSRS